MLSNFSNSVLIQWGKITALASKFSTVYFSTAFTEIPIGNLSFCTDKSTNYTPIIDGVYTTYVVLSRQFDNTQQNPTVDKMFIFIGY